MVRRSIILFSLAAGLASCATAAAAKQEPVPTDCSHTETDGTRTLCFELVVPAAQAEIWRLFTSTEGLGTWVAPVAAIDLRIGGIWEASYRPDARIGDPGNIRNRVLSYVPMRMLSIAVDRAPPDFPDPELVRTVWTVMEFERAGKSQTRVRVSMLGYRDGADYDRLFDRFKSGNAFTLKALHARVVEGPTDWAAAYAAPKAAKP